MISKITITIAQSNSRERQPLRNSQRSSQIDQVICRGCHFENNIILGGSGEGADAYLLGGNLTFTPNCDVGEQGVIGNILDTSGTDTAPSDIQGMTVSYNSCMKCPVGKFASAKNTDVCSDCPKGRYATVTGSTICEACPTGRYNENTTKSSLNDCIKCALGKYSNLIAAESQFTCQLCDSGTYGDELALAACKDCARGKYSLQKAAQCTNCAPGTYNNVTASMTCHNCASGKYVSVPGQTQCVDCSEGEYSGSGSATCQVCIEGTYRKVANTSDPAVACRFCAAGKYLADGGNACSTCALGKFAAAGAKECANCLAGSYAGSEGSASCSYCAPGKYSDLEGQAKCVDCFNGTYASSPGSIECTACSLAVAGPGPVTTLAPGASSSLECVCYPEYFQSNATPHNLAYREFYPTLTCPVGGSSSLRAMTLSTLPLACRRTGKPQGTSFSLRATGASERIAAGCSPATVRTSAPGVTLDRRRTSTTGQCVSLATEALTARFAWMAMPQATVFARSAWATQS